MNFSKIKENALKYLGYHHQILDEKMNVLIDECIEEIEKMSSFRATYRKFPLSFHPLRIDEISLNCNYKVRMTHTDFMSFSRGMNFLLFFGVFT